MKLEIIEAMKVLPNIKPQYEIDRRICFIKKQLIKSNTTNLVLGISGGIDSCVAGRLCQLATEQLNAKYLDQLYSFIAVQLPYFKQHDAQDAQLSCQFIKPNQQITVNIQDSVNAIHQQTLTSMQQAKLTAVNINCKDFIKGNTKARMRMLVQYEVAGLTNGLVVGTDHSAENITGFYTKWGDGACDLAPLFGLNKRQIKQIASYLGAPQQLINKIPTADLEDNNPQLPDELALGINYQQIDDFLEGKTIPHDIENKLILLYKATQHKRQPVTTLYNNQEVSKNNVN